MTSRFTLVTRVAAPVERVHDLGLDVDAHLASMAASDERAIGGVTSGPMRLGDEVTWRARHLGVWFTMTVRVTALDRPHRFVDEQVRGPFRSFRHEHVFAPDGEGTVMTDTITLASPLLGRVAERLVLVPYLRRLVRQRNDYLVRAATGRRLDGHRPID